MATKYIAHNFGLKTIEGSMAYIAQELNVTRQNVHNSYKNNTLCKGYKIKPLNQDEYLDGRSLEIYSHILFGYKSKEELANILNVTIKTIENITKTIEDIVYCKKRKKYTIKEDLPKYITSSFFNSFEFADKRVSYLVKELLTLKSDFMETYKLPKYLQTYVVCKIAQNNSLKISCDYKKEKFTTSIKSLNTDFVNDNIKIEDIDNVTILNENKGIK